MARSCKWWWHYALEEDTVKPAGRLRDITRWQGVKCKSNRKEGRKKGRKEGRKEGRKDVMGMERRNVSNPFVYQ